MAFFKNIFFNNGTSYAVVLSEFCFALWL